MDAEKLLSDLEKAIDAQLEQCKEEDGRTFTPRVCEYIATAAGHEKVKQMIINYVADDGLTIAQAINEIENDFNQNHAES